MSGLITPTRRIFVFRTENTPVWPPEEIDNTVNRWTTAFLNRVRQHVYLGMPLSEQEDINIRAATALLNQIAVKYNLATYSGDSSGTTITARPIETRFSIYTP